MSETNETVEHRCEIVRNLPTNSVEIEWYVDGVSWHCDILKDSGGTRERLMTIESHEISRFIEVLEMAEEELETMEEEPYV